MRLRLQRLLSVFILMLWIAPSVGASTTVLHVALDHHGAHDSDHAEEIADLVRAATHGHHHELTTAEHEHEVSLRASAALPKPLATTAVAVWAPQALNAPDEPLRSAIDSRRGPPRVLFRTHCSLLL